MQKLSGKYVYEFNTAPSTVIRGSVLAVRNDFFLPAVLEEEPFMKLMQFAELFLQRGWWICPCGQIYDSLL